jgi:hypothetical protein
MQHQHKNLSSRRPRIKTQNRRASDGKIGKSDSVQMNVFLLNGIWPNSLGFEGAWTEARVRVESAEVRDLTLGTGVAFGGLLRRTD